MAPATTPGLLIVIEGIDGAGTTTQARRLVAALTSRGHAAHGTREPSDGPCGRLLREMLAGQHAPIDQTTLALLFAADRADHVQREVAPALAAGAVVVSDRWYHSSLAYQGADEDRRWIVELNRRARRPDLTLFIEVDPEVAARRRADAGRSDEIFDALPMQRRVAAGYRAVIALLGDSEPIEAIDGHATMDAIAETIRRRVFSLSAAAGLPGFAAPGPRGDDDDNDNEVMP